MTTTKNVYVLSDSILVTNKVVDDGNDIARFHPVFGQILRQYDDIVFLDHDSISSRSLFGLGHLVALSMFAQSLC